MTHPRIHDDTDVRLPASPAEPAFTAKNAAFRGPHRPAFLHTRRTYPRGYRQAHIRYAVADTPDFHNAVLINESTGGLCFEADTRLAPGTRIRVQLGPLPQAGHEMMIYLAEVRWCRRERTMQSKPFTVGARYLTALVQ
ncbi:MAG: PilZ domain-containing protein [Thermodesulfobacteriota bacterium]|nr:PilZ domain-containing protein [Thermodesulfobacteriota bacterium]